VSPDLDWLRERDRLLEGDSVANAKARIDPHVAAANREDESAGGAVTDAFNGAILELHEQLTIKDAQLQYLEDQLAAANDEHRCAGMRERDARAEVAQLRTALAARDERLQELAVAVSDRERLVADASVEMREMQAWIHELEARLVGADKRRGGRWWPWR